MTSEARSMATASMIMNDGTGQQGLIMLHYGLTFFSAQ
ncbi:MAG: hypothetical protein AVDCRST_MAG27-3803 [uncultured Craurococcus sp.]|uniref:Uncharacterized protein n=1 Tax=uncultured Craurococcus sp. TaxID=1135998 RepID=A0A6J4JKR0_9PROT|nr:MAG: hypothetical protein AVDCRST_MAG27-3803 [uncultured Craurococcus sp.]